LTSRSSDVVCAPAALTAPSTAAATARHDALIRSRAMFLLEPDLLSEPFAHDRVPCVVTFTDAHKVPSSYADVTFAA